MLLFSLALQLLTCQLCVNSCRLSVNERLGSIHSFPASLSLVPKSPAEIPGMNLKQCKTVVVTSRQGKILEAVSVL